MFFVVIFVFLLQFSLFSICKSKLTSKSALKTSIFSPIQYFPSFTMAEQKTPDVVKLFENVQFAKVEDKYNIKLEFNANLGNISLEFMNKTNVKTFNQTFTQNDIDGITKRCQLSAEHLSQVMIDQLSSTEFTNKFCRMFLFSESTQGTI